MTMSQRSLDASTPDNHHDKQEQRKAEVTAPSDIKKDVSRFLVSSSLSLCDEHSGEQTRRLVSLPPSPITRRETVPAENLTALATLRALVVGGLAERDVGARTNGGLGAVAAVERFAGYNSVDFYMHR